jgi:hypothetical protein
MIKVLLFFFAVSTAFSAGWEAVQRIPRDTKIQVQTREAADVRGTFVSANERVVVVRSGSGEQSIVRDDVRRVRAVDPSRRIRNGLLGTAIGAEVGLAIGVAICPHCANEGAAAMYTGPLTAIGAGAGAAGGFLPRPYRTVYTSK